MASKPSASGRDLAKRACSMRKPGSAATPPEYWNWWAMKRYPPAGKGSTVGMGAASTQIGSEPNIARHLAFVIPTVAGVPKPPQTVETEAESLGKKMMGSPAHKPPDTTSVG